MSLHACHALDTVDRRRTLGEPADILEQAVILLAQQLSDQNRIAAALDGGLQIFWLKGRQ